MKQVRISLILSMMLFLQIFSVSAGLTEEVIINESFTLQKHKYVTFNLTNAVEFTKYTVNLTVKADLQLFIVDEPNFILFKNNQSFHEIDGNSVDYLGEYWGKYNLSRMYVWSSPSHLFYYLDRLVTDITVKQTGKIVVILSNGLYELSGVLEVKEISTPPTTITEYPIDITYVRVVNGTTVLYIVNGTTLIDLQNDTNTKSQTTTEPLSFFIFPSIVILVLVFIKRRKENQ